MSYFDDLYHTGVKRRSGRYKWGSGEIPYQHEEWFMQTRDKLKKEGMSEVAIANYFKMSTTEYRQKVSNIHNELKQRNVEICKKLKAEGKSQAEISRETGLPASTVATFLAEGATKRADILNKTVDVLKENVAKKTYIDVGLGTELQMGLNRQQLKNAIQKLQDEGYELHNVQVEQLGTGNKTTINVLCPPGTTYQDVKAHRDDIKLVMDHLDKNDRTFRNIVKPESIDSSRIQIRYAEEGGTDRDGLIELRRGVDDISLGAANYAQVRIAVDGTHYLKGMAVYADDLPKGVDIRFNTNKHVGTPMINPDDKDHSVLKPMKINKKTGEIDMDNPFGASIVPEEKLVLAQRRYTGKDGKEHLSLINIVNEEGAWSKWSKNLPSQFLSKQLPEVANKQLTKKFNESQAEFDELCSLTNPAVKKKLLGEFSEQMDADAVKLKAAKFPRQATHVILPFPDIKDGEIYAPNYEQGEEVILVRYPHAGNFESPRLKVNNNVKSAKETIGNARDAIGINAKAAMQMSGADFDGDTAVVIPTRGNRLKTSKIQELIDFDPKEAYPAYEGMKRITPKYKNTQMGIVSNLITDMTVAGATEDDIVKVVKHSMVIIDSEKHNLDWRRSEKENEIDALRLKYRGSAKGGASTLISRASSELRNLTKRKDGAFVEVKDPKTGKVTKKLMYIDPKTGEKLYRETPDTWEKTVVNKKTGEVTTKTVERYRTSTQMAEVKDAMELVSDNPTQMEIYYANYANRCKSLANEARKEMVATPSIKYSPSAKVTYQKEYKELKDALDLAKSNKPLERQAQILANAYVSAQVRDNPEIKEDKDQYKKLKNQTMEAMRYRVGAKKQNIYITDKQWEAIQAGAISNNFLTEILDNADTDRVRQLATPRAVTTLTPAKIARIKSMDNNGATAGEIAKALGVSVSTVRRTIDDKGEVDPND